MRQNSGFNREESGSLNDMDSGSDGEKQRIQDEVFGDIMQIKREVTFNEGMVRGT